MLSQVSVNLFRGGGVVERGMVGGRAVYILLECGLVTVRNIVVARLCFNTSLSFCSQGVGGLADMPRADDPLSRHPRADTPPAPSDGHCSGRYASY